MSKKKKDKKATAEKSEQESPQPQAAEDQAGLEAAEEVKAIPEAEKEDLLYRLQRVSADYLNYQKRAQRDLSQVREFANEELIKKLLPVLDDMERALAAALENHGENDPLFKGMQMVHGKALETLGRFGLRVIEAEGKEFDPDRHTALMQQPSAEHPPQTVLQEVQKGYELKGRTIRPAGVVVSKLPDQPETAERADDESNEAEN